MKVFIDTNVMLDFLQDRSGFHEDAVRIFQLSQQGQYQLLAADLSVANIKYITRKTISHDVFYDIMTALMEFVAIVPIGADAVREALAIRAQDFEDALQYFAALQAGADVLVTRNVKDFPFAAFPVLAPHEFLNGFRS